MADPFSRAKYRLLDRAMHDGRLTPASRLVFYEIIQQSTACQVMRGRPRRGSPIDCRSM